MANESPKGTTQEEQRLRKRLVLAANDGLLLEQVAPTREAVVLEDSVVEKVCEWIVNVGKLAPATAAQCAGIPKTQWDNWWAKGQHAKSGKYYKLRMAVEQAQLRAAVQHRLQHNRRLAESGTVADYEREGRQNHPEIYDQTPMANEAPAVQINIAAFFEEQRSLADVQRTRLIYGEMAKAWEKEQPVALPENTGNSR